MQRYTTMMVALLVLTVAACGDDETADTANNGTNNGPANNGANNGPANNGANNGPANNGANNGPANNGANNGVRTVERGMGWVEYIPGGDTICSRGTEYAYFVNEGTSGNVIVDFWGGGACWNELTCSVADAIFNPDVEQLRSLVGQVAVGIYDRENPDNPFKDWTHVVVPYCTGDVHWGDSTQTYAAGTPQEVTIQHRGATNARTALQYVYDNHPEPESVFVTGCSAGGYGSIVWGAHLMEHYPEAKVVQMSDSAAGVITDSFFQDSFPKWNALPALPDWIPGWDPNEVDIFALQLADLYTVFGNYYPNRIVAQYNTAFDENQTFYFKAMGGTDAEAWSEQMYAQMEKAEAGAPNFHAFIAPGEVHCIIVSDDFYTVESKGVKLVDWVDGLIAGGDDIESVYCEDCGAPGN